MKKVVILSAFLTPFRSGAEACAEEVAVALADRFDMTIVTARLRRDLPRQDLLRGKVRIVRVGLGSPIDKWLFPFLAPIAVKKLQPDTVHAVLESFAGLAMVLSQWSGVKAQYILTCQSTNTSFLVGLMHRAADRVTVLSEALKKRASAFGRNDAVIIPNGLWLKDIPEKQKVSGRILFAGRLEKMKGVDTLLEAFEKLPDTVTLHIVGTGSLRAAFEAQAASLGIKDRVVFRGFMTVPEVYSEFAEAEIFCGLSRSEAFGNVFVEAQAAECAVVATNVGGIPDIVTNGETGLLVPADTADVAAEAVQALIDHPHKRAELGAAGRKNAQQYDWSKIAGKYAAIYDSKRAGNN